MKFTDTSLSVRDLQNGDVVIEEARHFMVVKVVSDGGREKYGYMNLETGVVMSAKYDSVMEMYDDCFSPTIYDTQIRTIEEVVLKSL